MSGVNLNVVLLMFQPSIIAIGLEKKLSELGNNVTSVTGNLYTITNYLDTTDLFIFNLLCYLALNNSSGYLGN